MMQERAKESEKASASNGDVVALPPVAPGCVPKKLTPSAILTTMVKAGVRFFRDDLGRSYASIPCQGISPHRENWPLSHKSKNCCRLLRALLSPHQIRRMRKRCFRDAIELMEAMAADSADEVTLFNRISRSHDRSILIDMADPCWKAIQVSENGWKISEPLTPVFRRHKHQRALPTPISGGVIDRLFDFIPPSKSNDHNERLMILAWLVSALVPDVTTPIMLRIGQAGSAKTTTSIMLRSLIDPSTTEILGKVDRDQLDQVMFHHAIPCFDNLGRFSRSDADFFCRAVTGVGLEKRQLYTDMDEVLLKYQRSIILNGITLPTMEPDFLDRSLVFQVERLEAFRSRNKLEKEFRLATPDLLGGLLDLLVETLKHFPNIPDTTEFRMGDFARLGRAVARARKLDDSDFDNAYRSMLRHQACDALDSDPFAYAVVKWILEKDFEGTATKFLKELKTFVTKNQLECSHKGWPSGPRWVTSRLTELAPVLSTFGIRFERLPRQNNERGFCLSNGKQKGAHEVPESSTVVTPSESELLVRAKLRTKREARQ